LRKVNTAIEGGTGTEAISHDIEVPLTIGTPHELATPILLSEVSEQTVATKTAFVLEQLLKGSVIHLPQKRIIAITKSLKMQGLEVKQC